jgi:hypothetical protein
VFHFTVLTFAILVATNVFVTASSRDEPRKPTVTADELKDAPITIVAITSGQFSKGLSWHLSVNSARQAEITIETFPNNKTRRFELTKEQMDRFRSALVQQQFFELGRQYGEQVPDGSEKTLTVIAGRYSNSVKVNYLLNWVHNDKAKLKEPSRVVHLLVMIRGWFDDADAVDLRQYDRMVLDANK